MAILRGFPPSNTISPGPRIPMITEESVKITEVPIEGRFKRGDLEFMRISDSYGNVRAVCYIGGVHNMPGRIYGFSKDVDVIWYKEDYGQGNFKETSEQTF